LWHNIAMASGMKLRWKIYLFFFVPVTLGNFIGILHSESVVYAYYHVLTAFHPEYQLSYHLNIASAAISLFALIPIFLYAYRKPFLHPIVWQIFFFSRFGLDLIGHSYETQFLRSIFYTQPWIALSTAAILLAVIFPSYLACFYYAFRQEKMLKN